MTAIAFDRRLSTAHDIIAEQNRSLAAVHGALHAARIELGALLQVGAGPSTRRAFDQINGAIDRLDGPVEVRMTIADVFRTMAEG